MSTSIWSRPLFREDLLGFAGRTISHSGDMLFPLTDTPTEQLKFTKTLT